MEKLNKRKGKYYTQNADGLSIEERSFFTEGLVVSVDEFRFATDEELEEWEKHKDEALRQLLPNPLEQRS